MSMNIMGAESIIRDAGGRIIGRTRLQKIAYLLTASGLENGFNFIYKHYGPYSEPLATATRYATLFGYVNEAEQRASWGGSYSIYTVPNATTPNEIAPRSQLARIAPDADAVELELAATAVFLALDGFDNPWEETARRKPEKSDDGRIDRAKVLLRKLREINTPVALPAID